MNQSDNIIMTHAQFYQIRPPQKFQTTKRAAEQKPRRALKIIIAVLFLIFAAMMIIGFSDEPITRGRFLALGLISIMAAGFVCGAIFPRSGHWAYKLVAIVIFFSYAWYLVDELFITKGPLMPIRPGDEASIFAALVGFLFFGGGAIIYVFFNNSYSRLEQADPGFLSETDIRLGKFLMAARKPLLTIHIFLVIVMFLRVYFR